MFHNTRTTHYIVLKLNVADEINNNTIIQLIILFFFQDKRRGRMDFWQRFAWS